MDPTVAVLVAGATGAIGAICGAIAGVALGYWLEDRRSKQERARDFELRALDRAESRLIEMAELAIERTIYPRPVPKTTDVTMLIDLLFTDLGSLPKQEAATRAFDLTR